MIDYWKSIANKVIIFDNNSTDGSLELLSKYDWIEVRPYPIDPHDTIDDDIHRKIKNMCWKQYKNSDVDWVICSDLDETIWAKDLFTKLEQCKNNNTAIITPKGYDFVSEKFPTYTGAFAHEIIQNCVYTSHWNKPIIFDPNKVSEINYAAGGHYLENPIFEGNNYMANDIYLFHFKYLSADYLIKKRFATRPRLSEINRRMGWGYEYLYNEDQIRNQFNDKFSNANINVNDLLQ